MQILVETILKCSDDSDNEIIEQRKVIDYYDSSDRHWLRNHCVWAFNNSRRVSMMLNHS